MVPKPCDACWALRTSKATRKADLRFDCPLPRAISRLGSLVRCALCGGHLRFVRPPPAVVGDDGGVVDITGHAQTHEKNQGTLASISWRFGAERIGALV